MASYHLLQSTPQASHQHRKAYTFTTLILLVAFATLLTIIRFTLNPNLFEQNLVTPTNINYNTPRIRHQQFVDQNKKIKDEESKSYPTVLAREGSITKENIQVVKPTNVIDNGQQVDDKSANSISKPTDIVDNKQVDLNLPQSNLVSSAASVVNQSQDSSVNKNYSFVSSMGVTSLVADQRFEKEYRDDPVTVAAHQLVKREPKLIFDSSDLLETKFMKIDQSEHCGEENGGYADLLVVVNSAVNNFEARAAIRETWGKFAVERGAYFYFFLGSTDDATVQAKVEAENNVYNDILQGTFYDSYHNLTLKTISMMYWVANHCSNIRYVLKVDDDMMLNMQHICDFSEINPNFHKVIIGKLARKWKPHRDPRNKWYVPFKAYTGKYFPNFVTGPAYFFTGDAARPLYETSVNETMMPLYLEDVYMTGIVADKASIRRFNHALMRNVHIPNLNSCTFSKIMTSHRYTPVQIRQLWTLVYTQKCIRPPAAPSPNSTSNKKSMKPIKSAKVVKIS